jgi:hypothetical protein
MRAADRCPSPTMRASVVGLVLADQSANLQFMAAFREDAKLPELFQFAESRRAMPGRVPHRQRRGQHRPSRSRRPPAAVRPARHRGRLPVCARLPAAAACAGDRGAQRLRRDRRRSSGQRRHTPHPGIGRHGIHRATAGTRRPTWAGAHRTPNSCEVRSIATRFTTATCGSGCRGSWSVSVPYRAGPYPARHRPRVRGVRKGRYPPTRRHRAGGADRRTVRPSTRWQPGGRGRRNDWTDRASTVTRTVATSPGQGDP